MPIKREERNGLEVFHKFGQWLRTWGSSGEVGLSKQTFHATIQTTQVLIGLSNYLIDGKGLDYVLLGHISAYYLEGRCGCFGSHPELITIYQFCKSYKLGKL